MSEENKLKPLEQLAEDVKPGDIIRIVFSKGDYVGHVVSSLEDKKDYVCISQFKFDDLSRDEEIQHEGIFCGLTVDASINLKKKSLSGVPIVGYEVLKRFETKYGFKE